MTRIYFVRHAESYGNITRRAYGHFDGLVTPRGYKQIELLKKRFLNVHIDAVYSSDLTRAVETAKAISSAHGLPVKTTPKLREILLGDWEELPWGEIPSRFPEQHRNWVERPALFQAENGENFHQVSKRMREALEEIISENEGRTVAVVSHSAALRALINSIKNGGKLKELEKAPRGDNTCVSLFEYDNGNYKEIFLNDNSHLADMSVFGDELRWTEERKKLGKNLRFELASLPKDTERVRTYYSLAWHDVFGDDISDIRAVDRKVKSGLRRDGKAVAFGINNAGDAGMIVCDPSAHVCKDAGHISCIYVKPEYRRLGYGIQLIGHAMSNYAGEGKKFLSIRVSQKNTAACEFYKKYGFFEDHREQDGDTVQIVMLLKIA